MSHPWPDSDIALLKEVYELQCTSRMNAIYYGRRLEALQKEAFIMEVTTAITASGSGVAALALWNQGAGQAAWQALALVAAIVAVVKPLRAPGKRIEVFTRQQQGYHANYFAMKKLAFSIRQAGLVTDDHRKRFDTVYDRHVQLNTEDENSPDEEIRKSAQEAVRKELPPAEFWWPPDPPAPAPPDPPLPALTDARGSVPAGQPEQAGAQA
ncbi:hypothetical protein [Falsiroseomonas sp. CW058]|uniref:hypothetical protein n=1 Tax=Falsiroseomonas sp. CW058 TaxID=3388664 RepID=UPI003D310E6E